MFSSSRLLSLAAVAVLVLPSSLPAEVTVETSPSGAVVKIDGQLFTEYVVRDVVKPILWPVIGPTGQPMTANRPKDHVHHGSIWFTHGDVNGENFWHEKEGCAKTVHREFVRLQGGSTGTLVARNDWVSGDGKKQLEDERVLGFGYDATSRWIDYQITLVASEGAVRFGDTKEGTMGVRVPETVRVDSKKGGKIVNSRGQTDGAAWGMPAEWVDYYGPVADQTVGIAFFNHPSSFRYPTRWHVRTYGLYAANPFGVKSFPGGKEDSPFTLAAGKSLLLRYRILFHRGDVEQAQVAERFAAYSTEPAK